MLAKHALIALLALLASAITGADSPNPPRTCARYAPRSTARITADPEIARCWLPRPAPTAASNDLDFHFVMLYSI